MLSTYGPHVFSSRVREVVELRNPGPRTSRPQGFNYSVYTKSALSGVSKLVFNRFYLFLHCFSLFLVILAWFLTVFKVLRSDSNLFQSVLKRFECVQSFFGRNFPSRIPVFQASGRLLGPPSVQGPHMGSEKSKGAGGVV